MKCVLLLAVCAALAACIPSPYDDLDRRLSRLELRIDALRDEDQRVREFLCTLPDVDCIEASDIEDLLIE